MKVFYPMFYNCTTDVIFEPFLHRPTCVFNSLYLRLTLDAHVWIKSRNSNLKFNYDKILESDDWGFRHCKSLTLSVAVCTREESTCMCSKLCFFNI